MPNPVEAIQIIIKNTINALGLTNVMFGTITNENPLTVLVEQKMELTGETLIVPKSLTDYEVNIEIDTATESTSTNTKHTHQVNYIDSTINGSSNKTATSEIGEFDNTHSHAVKGTKTITIYNALKKGDKVILIRQQGGQKFLILDKR